MNEIDARISDVSGLTYTVLLEPKYYPDISKFVSQKLEGSVQVQDVSYQIKTAANVEDIQTTNSAEIDAYSEPSLANFSIAEIEKSTKGQVEPKGVPTDRFSAPLLKEKLDNSNLKCLTCMIGFGDERNNQRTHYQSDWHRVNLKMKAKGLERIEKEMFDMMTEGEKSSIFKDYNA